MGAELLVEKLSGRATMSPFQVAEAMHLLHLYGSDDVLAQLAQEPDLYELPGPRSDPTYKYDSQAEIALIGLQYRGEGSPGRLGSPGVDAALLRTLSVLCQQEIMTDRGVIHRIGSEFMNGEYPGDPASWPLFASLARRLADRLADDVGLRRWADSLDTAGASGRVTATRRRAGRRRRGGEGASGEGAVS